MNKKIKITYEDYDKYCELFDIMDFHADEYAPTVNELKKRKIADIQGYILFLLWIDSTGFETDENKESRHLIRKIINTVVEFVDEKQETIQ